MREVGSVTIEFEFEFLACNVEGNEGFTLGLEDLLLLELNLT